LTCIAGLVDKGIIYLGGDGAASTDTDTVAITNPKVFKNKKFLIGYSVSFRMGQLLQYKFNPPRQKKSQDDLTYLTTTFVDSVKNCFKDNEFNEENAGGQFLIGYKNNLYLIESTFHVLKTTYNYNAIGAGAYMALGSLFSTTDKEPLDRVQLALEAAAAFSTVVSAPFTVISSNKKCN
jgi:ATP-dependent protease HslVU (ClpYQ) peptidase subunit